MRVIAGRYKGRRLASPRSPGLRPTSDKLRETLFNILAPRIDGARVLDGFAGTGALGIEALSRGAAHVIFVDRDRRAMALVAENLGRCGITGGYAMIRGGVEAIAGAAASGAFDLILLDPPYDEANVRTTIEAVARTLADGGLLVLEHARRRPAPGSAGDLVCARDVVSGDSALAFYERGDSVGARRAVPLRRDEA
jgi:16S rRNA (guanine(966)-N(2))-methyltransferase RsmD